MPALKLKSIKKTKPPVCDVVIAAAGSSRRCKGEDKLLYEISGKPVAVYSIEAFQKCDFVREIVVVTRAELIELYAGMCEKYKLTKVTAVICGGDSRTESVMAGIFALSGKSRFIAVHDGARPCIDEQTILTTLQAACEYHAAAPGTAVIPTIKRVKKSSVKKFGTVITETVNRDELIEIQTPQIFREELIKAALTDVTAKSVSITDECMAVELLNIPVHVTQGSRRNIKITDKDDLILAEALLK